MTSVQPASRAKTAREFAYHILIAAETTGNFADQLLESTSHQLEPRQMNQARYLISTVIRRKLTLETVLKQFVTRDVEPGLWTLLKLGAAQILFGSKEHRHADVNETVEVARTIGKQRWCKFLNGVFRNLDRGLTDEIPQAIGPAVFPAGELRALNQPLFPDPANDLAGYLSRAYSLPEWLARRWSGRFAPGELLGIAGWFLSSPGLYLRVNLSRVTRDELLYDRIIQQGFHADPGRLPCSLRCAASTSPTDLPGWNEGLLVVQDETAQRAALTLSPEPGERVLDLCAAPGTKTTHLADLMHNQGSLMATDVSAEKLKNVRENAERCRFDIIRPQQVSPDGRDIPSGPFDAMLVDAPCSNTGVLGKRLEARWRITPEDITELSVLQFRLLTQAARRLKPGGRLLYSTCSIEPEENEDVVRRFLEAHPEFQLVSERAFLPGQPSDGGYQALLIQNSGGRPSLRRTMAH